MNPAPGAAAPPASRYEAQKRRDWNTFVQYMSKMGLPASPSSFTGAHALHFLLYLDQFGKTRVHAPECRFYGHPHPPEPCPCPLRQAWGSLDSLVGRLRAAFAQFASAESNNPFAADEVRLHLRHLRDTQSKARGVSYHNKYHKRRKPNPHSNAAHAPNHHPC